MVEGMVYGLMSDEDKQSLRDAERLETHNMSKWVDHDGDLLYYGVYRIKKIPGPEGLPEGAVAYKLKLYKGAPYFQYDEDETFEANRGWSGHDGLTRLGFCFENRWTGRRYLRQTSGKMATHIVFMPVEV